MADSFPMPPQGIGRVQARFAAIDAISSRIRARQSNGPETATSATASAVAVGRVPADARKAWQACLRHFRAGCNGKEETPETAANRDRELCQLSRRASWGIQRW